MPSKNLPQPDRHPQAPSLLLCDAHAHFLSQEEFGDRIQNRIPTLFNAANPAEARQLFSLCQTRHVPAASPICKSDFVFLSCGLHPWDADSFSCSELLPFFRQVPVIGEIGMDSVWCTVPLSLQEKQFHRQLAFACEYKKPVLLHTKGQERTIASIIKEYPNQYLVHWYSSPEPPEDFLALGCYVSIGPDVFWNPAVRQTAVLVPEDRLLIETDGLSAVRWAYEEAPRSVQPFFRSALGASAANDALLARQSLLVTLETIAALRGTSAERLSSCILRNFQQFVTQAPSRF